MCMQHHERLELGKTGYKDYHLKREHTQKYFNVAIFFYLILYVYVIIYNYIYVFISRASLYPVSFPSSS